MAALGRLRNYRCAFSSFEQHHDTGDAPVGHGLDLEPLGIGHDVFGVELSH